MYENKTQELENQIIVLYVLSKFDISITDKSLTELILQPGLVNYFNFEEALSNLIENKLINVFMDNDGIALYGISEEGKAALESLEAALPDALRNAYDAVLLKEKDKFTNETTINAYHFIDANNNNAVRCYIREGGNKIVDLRIPVPDKETALEMCTNWKANAYEMLVQIITTISGD